MSQKVVKLIKFGGVENFQLDSSYPIPELKDDYVRVRVKAASFNPVDYKLRQGKFGGELPMILGGDFAGVVEAVGKSVSQFTVGDEVYGMSLGNGIEHGPYAETITLTQDFINLKPKNLSFEQAASIVVTGLTALHASNKINLKPNQSVLIVGASGGVGQIQLQLAKNAGAKVLVLAGSDASAKTLTEVFEVPSENIIRYQGLSAEQLRDAIITKNGGSGVNASIDLFGGETIKRAATESLALGGHLVTIVEEWTEKAHYVPLYPIDSQYSLFNHDASYHLIFIAGYSFGKKSDWKFVRELLGELTVLYDQGKLKPPVVEVVGSLSVETVAKAHIQLEEHKMYKKLVMTNQ